MCVCVHSPGAQNRLTWSSVKVIIIRNIMYVQRPARAPGLISGTASGGRRLLIGFCWGCLESAVRPKEVFA